MIKKLLPIFIILLLTFNVFAQEQIVDFEEESLPILNDELRKIRDQNYDEIRDVDSDTKIQTEESEDEDIIRFDIAGSEIITIDDEGLKGGGLQANKTVSIDNTMTTAEIQALIDDCPKYIPYGKVLTFQFADGTYTQTAQLRFTDFYGGGVLYVFGNSANNSLSTTKAVYLNCSASDIHCLHFRGCNLYIISVQYLKIGIKTDTISRYGIYTYGCRGHNQFRYNYILGNDNSRGTGTLILSGQGWVRDSYYDNINTAISSYSNAQVMSYNNDDTGTMPEYGLYASYNSTIGKSGTQPDGNTADEYTMGGSVIRETDIYLSGQSVQVVNTQVSTVATSATTMPWDDTKPQKTEGNEYMTLAITPTSATNKLFIEVVILLSVNTQDHIQVALFQDDTTDALTAVSEYQTTNGAQTTISFNYYMTTGTTTATTFKVRAGAHTNTLTFNGVAGGRYFGGVAGSSITITEYEL